ncbi:MAG: CoA-binding domain protein [Frankiales bacterium]|nr:CoA-binding domain protein [Frankiales bacterium]
MPMSADRAPVTRMLNPRSIAIVGASRDPDKLGGKVLANLKGRFPGPLFCVNPKAAADGADAAGVTWVAEPAHVPDGIDVAVLAVPAGVAAELLGRGPLAPDLGGVVVLAEAAGNASERRAFEAVVAAYARSSGTRVLGPNSSGFRNYGAELFATFAGDVGPGSRRLGTGSGGPRVSLLSQSGAMLAYLGGTLLMDRGVELGYVVDTGNEIDVDAAECLSFLVSQRAERVGLVLEGTPDWRRFRESVAAAHAAGVDVVALQVGRSVEGRAISASHTGAVGGTAGAFRTVVEAAGATCASDESAFLDALTVPRRLVADRPRRVLLGSFSGGMNALIVDQLADRGLHLARLDPDKPEGANPADFGPAALRDTTSIAELLRAGADPEIGATVLFTGHVTAMDRVGAEVLGVIADGAAALTHPVVVIGRRPAGWDRPLPPNLVMVEEPRSAVRSLAHAFGPPPEDSGSSAADDATPADATLDVLPWPEAETLLRAAGLGVPLTRVVANADDAAAAARALGWPVVMKADAPGLLHRARLGLVAVGIRNEQDARDRFEALVDGARSAGLRGATVLVQQYADAETELFVGIRLADAFGPTMILSYGGGDVEAGQRLRIQLPVPLPRDAARRALCRLGVESPEVAASVERLGELAVAIPDASVLEINPLRISAAHPGGMAVDCVILRTGTREGDRHAP